MNECVVYHKHIAGMDTSDGYIGISKHFKERQKQHNRDAFVRNSIYTVHERMRMYGDEVMTSIIFEGSINDCFDLEEELRPRWHMGWNMAIGGGRPGSGWKPGRDWLDNRLWHPTYGDLTISKDFKLLDLAKKYMKPTKSTNGYSVGNLTSVLKGHIPSTQQWELSNLQLKQKVQTRYEKDWDHIYMKQNDSIILLHKSGKSKLEKSKFKTPAKADFKLFSKTSKHTLSLIHI